MSHKYIRRIVRELEVQLENRVTFTLQRRGKEVFVSILGNVGVDEIPYIIEAFREISEE